MKKMLFKSSNQMEKDSKILILGHNGMVGSSIIRYLKNKNYKNIIFDKNKKRIDLRIQEKVFNFFNNINPDYVFLAAAKVGGIHSNIAYPAQFIYDNLAIQCNVVEAARKFNVKKLLLLGSSCIYPKMSSQPIKEESLLSGPLEQTNEYYAIAKISGIKMCEAYWKEYGCNFISCQPSNLYGPRDKYDIANSHVIPAMIRRFHEAKKNNKKEVVIWGTGDQLREFLFVDDLAKACVFLMEKYNEFELINVGSGKEISIKELSYLIKKIVKFNGNICFDNSKPEGTPRKIMDNSKIFSMGWNPKTNIKVGIQKSYKDYLKRYEDLCFKD